MKAVAVRYRSFQVQGLYGVICGTILVARFVASLYSCSIRVSDRRAVEVAFALAYV